MTDTDDLNPSQREAVMHEGGHLLITAGPGTGKTHTLVARIGRVAASLSGHAKVLAVTFTNKAAGELRDRLEARGVPAGRYEATTFHSFALGILRRYRSLLKFPLDFSVITPEEVEALASSFWPGLTPKQRRGELKKVAQWKASLALSTEDPGILAFSKFLRGLGRVDFDDVLRDAVFLLRDAPDVRASVRAVYRHVMVDEYQDMNPIQEELLKCLAGDGVSVSAIGDPDQAIYGFRGSDAALFDRYPEVFSPCRVLALTDNYRSAKDILRAAGQVVARAAGTRRPAPTARVDAPGMIREYEAATDRTEAFYIAREIERLIGGTGVDARRSGRSGTEEAVHSFGDIAVLYRLNAQANALAEALAKAGIPFHVSGEKAVPDGAEDIYTPRVEKVSLMTLHASKGLEFPVVFITGCEDDLLPLDLEAFAGDPQEERRLFYVGMTRAGSILYLTRAQQRSLYGELLTSVPSRFLADIAAELRDLRPAAKLRRRPDQGQTKLF